MKKLLYLVAAGLLMVACAEKAPKDAFQNVVCERIAQMVGEGSKVSFESFERTDSTTIGKEMKYRKELWELHLKQDTKLYEKYKAKRMPVNADKHLVEMKKDQVILKALDALAETLSGREDEILYYDVKFSGQAKSAAGTTTFDQFMACITPEGEIMNLTDNPKALHQGCGRLLPGYLEIVKEDSAE